MPFAPRRLTVIDVAAFNPAAMSHPGIIGNLLRERYVRIRVKLPRQTGGNAT